MKRTKPQKNKLLTIITMPLRTLAKARDFYVRSMTNHAAKLCYGGGGWAATSYADPLPRSFSRNSSRPQDKDDLKELIRVASTSTLGHTHSNDHDVLRSTRGVPWSTSVGIGMAKIEEDKPCEFDDIGLIGVKFGVGNNSCTNNSEKRGTMKDKLWVFARSRSCAVGSASSTKNKTPVVF